MKHLKNLAALNIQNSLKKCLTLNVNNNENQKHNLIYLGTPKVSANTFEKLKEASRDFIPHFDICCVVTQPSRPKGRGNKNIPIKSPVANIALDYNYEENKNLLLPTSLNENCFLDKIRNFEPSLCITAAYGNQER